MNGKKIAGILIENSLRSRDLVLSVAGVGLNVNQQQFGEAVNAVSMRNISRRGYDTGEVMDTLCSCLESRYLQLKAGKYKLLDANYLDRLYRKDVMAGYLLEGKHVNGIIRSVSPSGKLIVEIEKERREFDLKEIIFA